MMTTRSRNRETSIPRRGVAAAEFAVCLPVLMLLVLGCLDFGRFAYALIAITNAAEEGATYWSLNPTKSQATVEQFAVDEVQAALNPDLTVTEVTATRDDPEVGDRVDRRVSVQVSYVFAPIIPWPGLPTSLTLNRKVVMPQTQ